MMTVDWLTHEHCAVHSLGGSMAMLASVDLEFNSQLSGLWGKVRGVYPYGQPMTVSLPSFAPIALVPDSFAL
jgi:Lipase (class 3)